MRTLLILLTTAALSHAAPSMQQPGGWTQGVKPNHARGKLMEKPVPMQQPAPVANVDQSTLGTKIQRSAPLSSSEIEHMVLLQRKYQADPVNFRGTPEETMLKAWKRNYVGSPNKASTDPRVNALWDRIIQGKKRTEQDIALTKEILTRVQTDPTKYNGSIEMAILKTSNVLH